MRGNYGYVSLNVDGGFSGALVVFDLSDEALPRRLASADIVDDIVTSALVRDYVYLFTLECGLTILNISHPENPFVLRTWPLSRCLRQCLVRGRYAYCIGPTGFLVLDLQDPASPVVVGTYDPNPHFEMQDLAVSGNFAYISLLGHPPPFGNGGGGLTIVDISDPTRPLPAGAYATDSPARVAVTGHYVLVDLGSTLDVLDVANSAMPVRVSSYPQGDWGYPGTFVATNNLAYRTRYYHGDLEILDVSNVTNIVALSTLPLNEVAPRELALLGDRIYLTGSSGLETIDIEDPFAPHKISAYQTDGSTLEVAVSGTYAYLAEDLEGVQCIDISNPSMPSRVAQYKNGAPVLDIAVTNHFAFVANHTNGLIVLDVQNPTAPFEAAHVATVGYAERVVVSWPFVYTGGWLTSTSTVCVFEVLSITNPAAPHNVGTLILDNFRNFAVQGNYAYVAAGPSGLEVIDVGNPAAPLVVGTYFVSGMNTHADNVAVLGSFAYVIYDGSLHIVDVSNPRNPVRVSTLLPGNLWAVDVSGGYAFATAADHGLYTFNLNSQANGVAYTNLFYPLTLKATRDYAYVADARGGLKILELSPPGQTYPPSIAVEKLAKSIRLQVRGQPARTIVLQTTSILQAAASWENIVTNFTVDGTFTFDFGPPVGLPAQFFRAISY